MNAMDQLKGSGQTLHQLKVTRGPDEISAEPLVTLAIFRRVLTIDRFSGSLKGRAGGRLDPLSILRS